MVKRFVTEDPIGLEERLNMYAYVDGNPVNFIDSLGLMGNCGITGSLCDLSNR